MKAGEFRFDDNAPRMVLVELTAIFICCAFNASPQNLAANLSFWTQRVIDLKEAAPVLRLATVDCAIDTVVTNTWFEATFAFQVVAAINGTEIIVVTARVVNALDATQG
jgi:hypothetical protein